MPTNDIHELREKEGGMKVIECGLTLHNESHGGPPLGILLSQHLMIPLGSYRLVFPFMTSLLPPSPPLSLSLSLSLFLTSSLCVHLSPPLPQPLRLSPSSPPLPPLKKATLSLFTASSTLKVIINSHVVMDTELHVCDVVRLPLWSK